MAKYLLLGVLAIAMVGCSGDQGESAMSPEAQAAAKEQANTPAPTTETGDPAANPNQVGGGTAIDPGESGR